MAKRYTNIDGVIEMTVDGETGWFVPENVFDDIESAWEAINTVDNLRNSINDALQDIRNAKTTLENA